MKARKTNSTQKGTTKKTPHLRSAQNKPVITVDYERYAHFLENSDLTEEQKQEFLQAIWNIVVEFVSLGFGVHPLQQAKEGCGQVENFSPKPPFTAPDAVYLDHTVLEQITSASDLETDAAQEGVE
ncbi:MAG: hypothetical protein AAF221_07855 [Pseudomonadota bacterium]